MNERGLPDDLQNLIGYRFHDEKILEYALTSHAGEIPVQKKDCPEPLAAVGDAILEAVVTCWLCEDLMQGAAEEVVVPRPEDVKRDRTRTFTEKHQLKRYVRCSREWTQEELWRTGHKPYDLVTESLVGAVFIDAERHDKNGFVVVKKVLDDLEYF